MREAPSYLAGMTWSLTYNIVCLLLKLTASLQPFGQPPLPCSIRWSFVAHIGQSPRRSCQFCLFWPVQSEARDSKCPAVGGNEAVIGILAELTSVRYGVYRQWQKVVTTKPRSPAQCTTCRRMGNLNFSLLSRARSGLANVSHCRKKCQHIDRPKRTPID